MGFLLKTIFKEIKRRFNDPLGLFMWFMIPVVLGGLLVSVLGGSGGPTPKAVLYLSDEDETFISQAIPRALTGGQLSEMIEVREVTTAEGQTLINEGEGSAFLVIPKGFGEAYLNKKPVSLSLITNPSQSISPRIIRDVLQAALDLGHYIQLLLGDEIALIVGPGQGDIATGEISGLISGKIGAIRPLVFPPVIEAVDDTPKPEGTSASYALLMFPGILVMAIVFAGQGVSGIYWLDKDKGIIDRWRAGPNGMWVYWTGLFIASMFLVGIVTLPILLAGFYLLDIPYTKIATSMAWIMLTGPLMFGFMVIFQVLAPSRKAGGIITTIAVFPLLMAGGSFFPRETLPEFFKALADYTPNGNILEPLKQYFMGTYGSSGLFANLLPIFAITVVLIVISSVVADRKELRS